MSWLNTVRSAASTAASYIPGASYFSGETAAPAGTTAANATRRNNRNAVVPALPENVPVVAVPVNATAAPAPAPVSVTGGGAAETPFQKRLREARERNAAAKAAANKRAANQARLNASTARLTNWSSPEARARAAREAAEFNARQAARTAELMAIAKEKAGTTRRRRSTRKAGRR